MKPYLGQVQSLNNRAVNECLNQLYIQDEDPDSLRASITLYENFDEVALAQQLETHPIAEFRLIAAHLFKGSNQWRQSVEMCKRDQRYEVGCRLVVWLLASAVMCDPFRTP